MSVTLRPLNITDLPACFVLTQKLRWSHRLEDWMEAFELGEGIVAVSGSEVVGSIFFWRWGAQSATIGLVIVDDAYQGQGIGKQLMMAALAKLEGLNVRLHATEMGKGLYAKLGFVAVGNIHQYQTSSLNEIPPFTLSDNVSCRKATEQDIANLGALDASASGMERRRLLAHLYKHHQILVATTTNGSIVGFAARRKFGRGWAIGPIVAESADCAKKMITVHLQDLKAEFVRIDATSETLKTWLESAGFADVDAPVTMVRGSLFKPRSETMETFGLMTQAMA